MMEFDEIFLIWRKGVGNRRHKVGVLNRDINDRISFRYFPEALALKQSDGFIPYTEFQDLDKEYTENVIDIFAQRLTKIDRPDIQTFLNFWEVDIEKAHDKFYLLGKTQGLVATDNFEFLAQYKLLPETHFLTELAGLSIGKIDSHLLMERDVLTFNVEPENEYDAEAIKVFKEQYPIGYIKKYQTGIFHDPNAKRLKLSVKALEKNGTIKRVFIKVSNT